MSRNKLALHGGRPIRDKPLPPMYPGASFIEKEEIEAVREVLESRSLFRWYGPNFLNFSGKFEEAFAKYLGAKYALGVNGGASALHCALVGFDIGPEDEVILPTYGWVACPCAIVACGAKPVLANIDESLTLDPSDVEDKITDRTKAIMAVHIRGACCDMDSITRIAKEYQIKVVEDCAQAAGGSYKGRKLGSIGDAGTFSFQLNKMISAGEGGAMATSDSAVFERASLFHDAGAPYRAKKLTMEPRPGVNYRMTELTAAIMSEQLKKIDKVVSLLRTNKEKIKRGISDIENIRFRKIHERNGDVAVCLVFFVSTSEQARKFEDALHAENVYTISGAYPPVILRPDRTDGHVFTHWTHIFKGLNRVSRKYSRSVDLLSRAVHLDISPLLSEEDIASVVEGVHKVASAIL